MEGVGSMAGKPLEQLRAVGFLDQVLDWLSDAAVERLAWVLRIELANLEKYKDEDPRRYGKRFSVSYGSRWPRGGHGKLATSLANGTHVAQTREAQSILRACTGRSSRRANWLASRLSSRCHLLFTCLSIEAPLMKIGTCPR